MQWSQIFPAHQGLFGGARLIQHALWLPVYKRIQPGIELFNAVEMKTRDFHWRNGLRPDLGGNATGGWQNGRHDVTEIGVYHGLLSTKDNRLLNHGGRRGQGGSPQG